MVSALREIPRSYNLFWMAPAAAPPATTGPKTGKRIAASALGTRALTRFLMDFCWKNSRNPLLDCSFNAGAEGIPLLLLVGLAVMCCTLLLFGLYARHSCDSQ